MQKQKDYTLKTVVSPKHEPKDFRLKSLALASLLGLGAATTPFSLLAQGNTPKWAEGRVLVKAVTGLPDSELGAILSTHGGQSVGKIQQIGIHVVNVPPQAEEKVATALAHNPNIEFAELDMLVAHDEFIPDDPKFSSQWHHTTMQSSLAWDSVSGSGITVAILDTGVDGNHPDLKDNLLAGWNAVDQSNNWADLQGHGTQTSGTAAAVANNGTGVAGVAWGVRILPIRVSNDPSGYAYFSDIARGVTWAADHGARVANISYGVSNSSSVSSAARYMKGKGGLVVASAGNSGTDLGFNDNSDIISVSATSSSDTITSWSSYGNFVDVAAPGLSILTTTKGGGYASVSGTSFSSPATVGVVALIMSANPSLTPDEVENILENSAKDLGTAGWDKKYGHGRVDAAAAVQLAISTDPIPAPDPTPADTTAPTVSMNLSSGAVVSGIHAVTVTANDDTGVSNVELFVNGNRLGTDTAAPYTFSWDTTQQANGSAVVEARASDAAGNVGSFSVSVTIDNVVIVDVEAPSVEITSLVDGDVVSGTVKIDVVANDNIGVKTLVCYVDGGLIGMSSDVSTLTCNWNTRKEDKNISHTITAVANDAAHNSASASVTVTIGNSSKGSNGGKGNGKGK